MHLTKLEMQGFKSFADRIELHFDPGITGIVGPNGSGKSNIGDAMRWVLGEQNARQLRGARMEDIIFNGTEKRKPLSFCEVRLTFNNEDGALPVDFSEVAITRRVYRSGESEYYINRNSCRLKDIVDLFRDTGVGKQGYSIIGQGQIHDILSAKPEDRREIFHEAAGIMKYRARRDEAQHRLENTRVNLQRLSDIMDEMELQLEPLRVQSENARSYITLSGRLKDLEVNRFLLTVEKLRTQSAAQRRHMDELTEAYEEQEALQTRREASLTDCRGQARDADDAAAGLQRRVMELQQQLSQRQSRHDVLAERLEGMRTENLRIREEADAEEKRAAELRREAAALLEALEEKKDLSGQDAALREHENRLAALDETIGRLEEALEDQKSRIMDAMTRSANRKSSQTRLDTLRESVEKRFREIGEQKAVLQRDAENSRAVQDEIETRMNDLKARRDEAASTLEQQLSQVEEAARQREELAREMEKLKQQMQAARTRMTMLQSMKREYEGYGQSVKRLMADARSKPELESRIVGVVAELIEAPRAYLTAVETALGAAMQHIVTPTEEDAKLLIAHLRQQQYGRATFLPLSAIRSRGITPQERAALRHPGCHGVASELVTADDRLREIVGNLLGRTVIAEDMDAAIAIARSCGHSLRVVTLQGDVIHSGGSMTGGSTHSKFTSIMGRELELEETEKRGRALSAQLKELSARYSGLQQTLERDGQNQQGLTDEIHEADVALAREQERHQKAIQNLARLAGEDAKLEAEREQLAQNLADIESETSQNRRQDDHLAADENTLREDAARNQRRLNELREQRDELTETLTGLRVSLAADQREKDALRSQSERLEREAGRLAQSALRRLEQIEVNEQTIGREQAALSDTGSEAEGDEKALAEVQAALARAEEQRRTLQGQSAQWEEELRQVRQRLGELTAQRHETEMSWTRAESELETLQNRIWENYELTLQGAESLRREDFDLSAAEKEMNDIRRDIRKLGTVNLAAVEDYEKLRDRHEEYVVQRNDLEKGEADLLTVIEDLDRKMESRFRREFAKLNEYFGETFAALFGGGKATLVLEDEQDILSSGIEIKAQPVGKSLQLLSLFSGGEKALIATALLFAMLKLRPSPFCILDEIEAALDEANLQHFADYLKQYANTMQFIVVTHRKPTMEAADRLYGVTMEEKGISRMISMKISDYTGEVDHGKTGPVRPAESGT